MSMGVFRILSSVSLFMNIYSLYILVISLIMFCSCGSIALDVIFQRYLRQYSLEKFYTDNMHDKVDQVEHARNDFLRSSVNDYDYWLLNKDWYVLPTIKISKTRGPVVLTCRYHSGGNQKMTIHTPRLPQHILPSSHSDQLCHAVIQCRTIKPMRRTKYSTQFELYEQKGTFNGIDTFGLTDFQDMSISSELLSHYESLAIHHRSDINALLNKLVKEEKIGKCVANKRREEAKYRVQNMNFNLPNLISGSTYVPIEATMKYVNEQSTFTNYKCFRKGDQPQNRFDYFRPIWPIHLYPCQKYDAYGARFPIIPDINPKTISDDDAMDNKIQMVLWSTLGLLICVGVIWDTICNVPLNTSQWEGWVLNYLSKNCFPSQCLRYQNKSDPFKPNKMKTANQLFQKFNHSNECMTQYKVIFERANENIFIVDCDMGDNTQTYHELINNHDVLLYQGFQISNGVYPEDVKTIRDKEYELRFICGTREYESRRRRSQEIRMKWDGFIYARHGGQVHQKWWYYRRFDNISIQHTGPFDFESYNKVTLAYVRKSRPSIEEYKKEFMTYIGGKKNLYCHKHKTPLIASTLRDDLCMKCLKKKEYYRCCTPLCITCICKKCADQLDPNVTNFIRNERNNDSASLEVNIDHDSLDMQNCDIDDNTVNSGYDNESDNSSLLEPFYQDLHDVYDNDVQIGDPEINNNIMTILENNIDENFDDNFADFVITSDEPDEYHGDDHDYFGHNVIPTTNAAEKALLIKEAQATNTNRISGHVILNQCGSLLNRTNHNIQGSSKHKFFLQKIHSTSDGESIPLLYPESMLFPSIFPFSDPENIASVGCIPAPLLSKSMETKGFESIPQHIRTRLTTPFCKYIYLTNTFFIFANNSNTYFFDSTNVYKSKVSFLLL